MKPPRLFAGPVKTSILEHLSHGSPLYAADLCRLVFGDAETANRNTLRVLINQMRPKLRAAGWDIQGRAELKMNAYRLVHVLMEGM